MFATVAHSTRLYCEELLNSEHQIPEENQT